MSGLQPSFYRIYDGEYFTIIKRENDILFVQCQTCGPESQALRSSAKSNGNILKHIKRRHPDLLNRIREEKNIKARTIKSFSGAQHKSVKSDADDICNASSLDGSADNKSGLGLYVAGDSNHAETKYITTSTPATSDSKSPYAAQITVHVKALSPAVDTSTHQNNSNSAIIQAAPEQQAASINDNDTSENIEYLALAGQSIVHHNNTVVRTVNPDGSITLSRPEKRRLVTTNPLIVPIIKRTRTEFIVTDEAATDHEATGDVDDGDEEDGTEQDANNGDHATDGNDSLTRRQVVIECDVNDDGDGSGSEQYFGTSDSRYLSVNRTLDNHREILALRKQLMVREFEMVQQKHQLEIEQLQEKHRLEIELRQRDLDYRREEHQKTMQCLNKRLLEK